MTNDNDNIASAINKQTDILESVIEQNHTMGDDDIYGFTPNSNLGQIAYNLDLINKTLKDILDVLKTKAK